jgi:polyhydroxyalkanoate synthesis regulator phasin
VAAQSGERPESGVADALRDAVRRTFSAAGGSARAGTSPVTRERAAQLVDELARLGRQASVELARRGQGAREELARRSQDAGADLARRGQEATGEVAQRLEALERRLATLEEALGGRQGKGRGSNRKAEG